MASAEVERGRPLSREQADKARRSIRRALLIAVVQTIFLVALVALAYSDALTFIAPLAALYLLSVPLLLRHLERDIERRVVPASVQDKQAESAFGSGRSR